MHPHSASPALQRLWADEVLRLHALWHQGPPPRNPNPNPDLRPSASAAFKKTSKNKKKKKIKNKNKNEDRRPSDPPAAEIEWPTAPSLPLNSEPAGWPDPAPATRAPLSAAEQERVAASRAQQKGLRACRDFFWKNDGSSSSDDEMEDEEEEVEESRCFDFFIEIFKKDQELRGYYERNFEKGEFLCLVCGGIGVKLGKKFGDCVGLVQHSNSISKTKRRGAHRAFGRAVCRVLGWNINRLPNIVLDLEEPLGKSLANASSSEGNLQKEGGIEEIEEEPHKEVPGEEELVTKREVAGKDEVLMEVTDHGEENIEEKMNKNMGSNKKGQEQSLSSSSPLLPETAWSCKPLEQNAETTGWADFAPMLAVAQPRLPPTAHEDQSRAAATRVQHKALSACRGFFTKEDASSSEEDDEDERDDCESAAFLLFLGLFEQDGNLRDYYEKNFEKGNFFCLVCESTGKKMGKRFENCVALVQHCNSISKTKRKGAHRGFGRLICRVLGWDFSRLPSIVLDLKGPLGQSLAKVSSPQKKSTNGDLISCPEVEEIIEQNKVDSVKKHELLKAYNGKLMDHGEKTDVIHLSDDDVLENERC